MSEGLIDGTHVVDRATLESDPSAAVTGDTTGQRSKISALFCPFFLSSWQPQKR
jgi:hypothetical protein